MEFLRYGINKPCGVKAGVKTIKIAKWNRGLFYEKSGNELINIQPLDFYEFNTPQINYSSTIEHDDEGEFYNISIDFQLSKITKDQSENINLISELQLIAILNDEYGNDVVFGLESGLTPNITEDTGGAKNSFNGYNVALTGEQVETPLFSQLFAPTQSNVLTISNDVLIVNHKVLQL